MKRGNKIFVFLVAPQWKTNTSVAKCSRIGVKTMRCSVVTMWDQVAKHGQIFRISPNHIVFPQIWGHYARVQVLCHVTYWARSALSRLFTLSRPIKLINSVCEGTQTENTCFVFVACNLLLLHYYFECTCYLTIQKPLREIEFEIVYIVYTLPFNQWTSNKSIFCWNNYFFSSLVSVANAIKKGMQQHILHTVTKPPT